MNNKIVNILFIVISLILIFKLIKWSIKIGVGVMILCFAIAIGYRVYLEIKERKK